MFYLFNPGRATNVNPMPVPGAVPSNAQPVPDTARRMTSSLQQATASGDKPNDSSFLDSVINEGKDAINEGEAMLSSMGDDAKMDEAKDRGEKRGLDEANSQSNPSALGAKFFYVNKHHLNEAIGQIGNGYGQWLEQNVAPEVHQQVINQCLVDQLVMLPAEQELKVKLLPEQAQIP